MRGRLTFLVLTATVLSPVVLSPALGCGGQFGEETAICSEIERTVIPLDQQSALGFVPEQLRMAIGGERTESLFWVDERQTAVTINIAPEAKATLVDREWIGESIPESGFCDDVIVFATTLTFNSEDDELDIAIDVEAIASEATFATFDADLSALIDAERFQPSGSGVFKDALLSMTVEATSASGAISGRAESQTDDTVAIQSFPVATFGVQP